MKINCKAPLHSKIFLRSLFQKGIDIFSGQSCQVPTAQMVNGTEKQTQLSISASEEQHMPDSFPGKSDSCYLNIQKLELKSTMKKIKILTG